MLNPSACAWPLVWEQAGCDVGEIPFEQTVRHYLREGPRESAERAARIASAYFR